MRNLFLFIIIFFATGALGDDYYPAANVEYVKSALSEICPLTNSAPDAQGANMEYLLKTIDLCNAKLGTSTSYGTSAAATQQWANINAVNAAVDMLMSEQVVFCPAQHYKKDNVCVSCINECVIGEPYPCTPPPIYVNPGDANTTSYVTDSGTMVATLPDCINEDGNEDAAPICSTECTGGTLNPCQDGYSLNADGVCEEEESCVSADTKIYTDMNGNYKLAKDIARGDMVLSYNTATRQFVQNPVLVISKVKAKLFHRLHFSNGGFLDVNTTHPLYSLEHNRFMNVGYVTRTYAEDFPNVMDRNISFANAIGKEFLYLDLKDGKFKAATLTSVERKQRNMDSFTFTVFESENHFANEFPSVEYVFQNPYEYYLQDGLLYEDEQKYQALLAESGGLADTNELYLSFITKLGLTPETVPPELSQFINSYMHTIRAQNLKAAAHLMGCDVEHFIDIFVKIFLNIIDLSEN
jgi:hypothetical protein